MIRNLRTLLITTLVGAALAGAAGVPAGGAAAIGCPGQITSRPFLPWLDPGNYVLLQNGALENAGGWTLSNGAKLVAGNEPFRVNSAKDQSSLSLPSGSTAASPPLCITLLHPVLRFFAVNTGSLLSTLKVEAITNLAGVQLTTPVGLLLANGSWKPTLPLPFVTNLISPLTGTVSFRFTPVGPGSGWRIDDVYVDPYKSS